MHKLPFGVKGGLNVSSMKLNSELFSASNKTGFFIGPTAKFSLPIVGVGMDASLLYDQEKLNIGNRFDGTTKLIQSQIVLPINFRYSAGLGSFANVFGFAGPQFGFNVGDKSKTIIQDVADWKFSNSNFSINLGVGATLFEHLQVTASYNVCLWQDWRAYSRARSAECCERSQQFLASRCYLFLLKKSHSTT